jgi:hypothetical protein
MTIWYSVKILGWVSDNTVTIPAGTSQQSSASHVSSRDSSHLSLSDHPSTLLCNLLSLCILVRDHVVLYVVYVSKVRFWPSRRRPHSTPWGSQVRGFLCLKHHGCYCARSAPPPRYFCCLLSAWILQPMIDSFQTHCSHHSSSLLESNEHVWSFV